MDKSVVEGCLDVANAEDVLGVLAGSRGGGSVVDDLLLLSLVLTLLSSLGLHVTKAAVNISHQTHHVLPIADFTAIRDRRCQARGCQAI